MRRCAEHPGNFQCGQHEMMLRQRFTATMLLHAAIDIGMAFSQLQFRILVMHVQENGTEQHSMGDRRLLCSTKYFFSAVYIGMFEKSPGISLGFCAFIGACGKYQFVKRG